MDLWVTWHHQLAVEGTAEKEGFVTIPYLRHHQNIIPSIHRNQTVSVTGTRGCAFTAQPGGMQTLPADAGTVGPRWVAQKGSAEQPGCRVSLVRVWVLRLGAGLAPHCAV